jgi:hypothetical protein
MFASVCYVGSEMYKRAQGRTRIGKKNFKKRWFCLTSRELTYHRQQGRVVLGLRCGFTLLVHGAAVIAAQ